MANRLSQSKYNAEGAVGEIMGTPPFSHLPPRGFFVTGTDTGVGKTVISCALLHAFAQRGARAIGMKPVAAGAVESAGRLLNADVSLLRAASNVEAPLGLVNPYCFKAPIAPHIAAQQVGVDIDVTRIGQAFAQLAAMADVVIVEGVGGFCVPLNSSDDSADLVQSLGLPVILVVGMRLGCLNHALLTAHAIRARRIRLAGWIANHIDAAMDVVEDNIAALANRLDAPLLGEIEFTIALDPQRVAATLDLSQLR
jgi:dethiobiotin synthetase